MVFRFKSLPLRKPPGEREGSDVAEHVAPGIGNHIEQPGSVAEARDRPFVTLFRRCRVPDPYLAVALRVSGCLLRSRRSPLRLSFLSEVGFLSLCPRSSAVCVEYSQSEPYFSGGLPLVYNLAVYGVAVAEERSTHYDTADIALAIIVSPDTSGAPALAFGNHIFSRKQPCRWW